MTRGGGHNSQSKGWKTKHARNGEVQNEEVRQVYALRKVRDYLEQTSLGHCIAKYWNQNRVGCLSLKLKAEKRVTLYWASCLRV